MSDIQKRSDQREYRIPRRHVLGTIAGATIGLSGCLGWIPTGSNSSTVIDGTSFSKFGLTVRLSENSKAQSIGLIDSTGKSVVSGQLSTGQTKVTLPLVKDDQPLAPGTYEVVVGRDGSSIDKQSVDLTAEWALAKVQPHSEKWNDIPADLAITIKNTGMLPLKLVNLRVEGVPKPMDHSPTRINPKAVSIEEQQLIGIDESAAFRTEIRPFEYDESAKSPCGKTKQATLSLVVKPTDPRQFNATVRYTGGTVPGPPGTKFCKNITIENVSKQS